MCELGQLAVRNASVTANCLACGALLPTDRPRRYCSPACRQRAFRARRGTAAPAWATQPAATPADPAPAVYECSSCGERLLERRCPECNLFARRLGAGGMCGCGDILTFAELAGGATG